jgi:DNA polymerase-3 subunit delta
MKIAAHQAEGWLARRPSESAVLVFGPDASAVADAARRVIGHWSAPDTEIVRLTDEDLRSDPARLSDALGARALFGGETVVRVVIGGESPVVRSVLEDLDKGASLNRMVVEAGELGKASKTRLAFEGAARAVAVQLVEESEEALAAMAVAAAGSEGLTLDPQAVERLLSELPADRGVIRAEIAKLALYMHANGPCVTEDDVAAVVGAQRSDALDGITEAVTRGDIGWLADRAGAVCAAEGAITVLRAVMRRFNRLAEVRRLMGEGRGLGDAVGALKPPVFFKVRAAFERDVRRWDETALVAAAERLWRAEQACKQAQMPQDLLVQRALLETARLPLRVGTAPR